MKYLLEYRIYEATGKYSTIEYIEFLHLYWSHYYEIFKKNDFDHMFSSDLQFERIAKRLNIHKSLMTFANSWIFETDGVGKGALKKLKEDVPPTKGDATELYAGFVDGNRKGAKQQYKVKKKIAVLATDAGKIVSFMKTIRNLFLGHTNPKMHNLPITTGALRFKERAHKHNIKDATLIKTLKYGELEKVKTAWALRYPFTEFTLESAKAYIQEAEDEKNKKKSK